MIHKTYLLAAVLLCAAPAAADAHCWRAAYHCGPVVQAIGAVEVAPNVYVLDDLASFPYLGPRMHRRHHHHWRRLGHWRMSYAPMRHYYWHERSMRHRRHMR
jgi:hypothetical protein